MNPEGIRNRATGVGKVKLRAQGFPDPLLESPTRVGKPEQPMTARQVRRRQRQLLGEQEQQ